MGFYSTKFKKLLIFQERSLKSEAKKISHFLKVSKTKFIHSSDYHSKFLCLQ